IECFARVDSVFWGCFLIEKYGRQHIWRFRNQLLSFLALKGAISDSPQLLGLDAFDERVVVPESLPSLFAEAVLFPYALLGNESLGIARAINDQLEIVAQGRQVRCCWELPVAESLFELRDFRPQPLEFVLDVVHGVQSPRGGSV